MTVPETYQKRISNLKTRSTASGLSGVFNFVTRSNIYDPGQMADFIKGLLALKQSGIYDQFVQLHMDAMAGGVAHNGPAFLPWHRRLLFEFELNMAVVLNNQNYALPYWDWSADLAQLTSQGKTLNEAPVYAANGLGASIADNAVDSPFDAASWKTHDISGTPNIGHLLREFSSSNATNLANPGAIANILLTPGYETTDANGTPGFRPLLEGDVHNTFHAWVGGQMDLPFSPDDPTFFLHHCFMDKLWAEWQFRYFGYFGFESPNNQPGQTAGQPMQSAAGVNWSNVIGAGNLAGISDTKPEDWEIHESFGYRYDDEMSWNKLTLLRPTDPNIQNLMADGSSGKQIGLIPIPADDQYQSGIFVLRPGYFSSPTNKSAMIQSVPLSQQTFGTNINYTDPNQGVYYLATPTGGFTASKYGFDPGFNQQTDQIFEVQTFAMQKALSQGEVEFLTEYYGTPWYLTTNNNNSALVQGSNDDAENFMLGLLPVPR